MLRFDVFSGGQPARHVELSGAYVFGQDSIPVRSDIASADGQVTCIKRVPGACGLSLLWDAGSAGRIMLSTTRIPERKQPYNLNVELARAQIARLAQKREDWGLFDFPDAEGINRDFDAIKKKFVEALQCDQAAKAAVSADESLNAGITLGEKMALFHADILLAKRKINAATGAWSGFGCMVDLFSTTEDYTERLRETFDFVNIPMPWKHTEPKERQYQYMQTDAWVNWAALNRRPIHAGPLLSFEPAKVPEWLFIWENDYETLRDMIYEHIQRMVTRYEKQVRAWTVVSGLHAYNSFNLNFEQLMELTRMSCLLVKKLAPNSKVIIELAMPWGEYYARNQRTIPPLLYADMAVQGGTKFDAFALQFYMGVPVDGYYVRDIMQVSSMLDEFVGFGKPLHLSACQAPSDITPDAWDAWGGKESVPKAGKWHADWSPRLQAEWLQAMYRIAMSKPFIESISWRDLADYEGHYIPHGGLCRNSMDPKLAYRELKNFKSFAASPAVKPKPPL